MKHKKDTKTKDKAVDIEISTDKELIEQLQEKVAELEKEKQQTFEKLQRISADYANYQKRTPKQIADSVAYEKKAIIKSLLPTLDNMSHAISSARATNENTSVESIIKGVQIVFDHMLEALKSHGVERIVALGEEFDPSLHEAMQMRAEEDKPDNVVLEEFQNGYKLNGLVIRPAKVIVNKLSAKQAEEETPKDKTENDTEDETTEVTEE